MRLTRCITAAFMAIGAGFPVQGQQSCPAIQFVGANQAVLATYTGSDLIAGATITANTYTGARIDRRTHNILGTIPNFLDLLLPCTVNSGQIGSLGSKVPPRLGAGSQFALATDLSGKQDYGVVLGGILNGVTVYRGNPLSATSTTYATGPSSVGVSVGDFNGDGKPDLAVVYQGDGSGGGVSILLGNGDGTFQTAVNYTTASGGAGQAVAIGDFNGDNKQDIALADTSGVSILLGNGDGTFTAGAALPIQATNSVTAADLNGDGKIDLAIPGSNGLSIALGNGDGTFRTPTSYPTPATYVAVGDFNGDGKFDLAAGGGGTVTILLNNGDGTFRTGLSYLTAIGNHFIIMDINNDGKADIVAATGSEFALGPLYPSGGASVLLGNGDGTFKGAPVYFPGQSSSSTVAPVVGDFNGDGKPDIATTSGLLLNAGGGIFKTAPAPLPFQRAQALAAADFNGDGKLDLAWLQTSLFISLGNGDGTFGTPATYAAGGNPRSMVTGDFNGDGKTDVAVIDGGDPSGGTGTLYIFLGNGDGTLQSPITYKTGILPVQVVTGDFNGDGKLDLAVANSGYHPTPGNIAIFLGKGDGTFADPVDIQAGSYPLALAVGDLNGDHKADLVVGTVVNANYSGYNVAVLLGNGDGTFQAPRMNTTQEKTSALAVQDFNGDGKADVLVAHCCGSIFTETTFMLGNGDGTLQPEVTMLPTNAESLAVGDFSGGGKRDLAVGIGGYAVAILLNASPSPPAVAHVNAASFRPGPVAPESIVSAFGSHLATATATPKSLPLPTQLGGTIVSVKDSIGTSRQAPLFYVSPGQVNYEVPAGTAVGNGTVTVTAGDGTSSSVGLQVSTVAPGLFTLNTDGLAAANLLRVSLGNVQTNEAVYQVDPVTQQISALPIDLGPATDQVYLILFGTGIRSFQTSASVQIGGINTPLLYTGPQGYFVGLDQVNLLLPRSLAGQGKVTITLMADGVASNTVNVTFK